MSLFNFNNNEQFDDYESNNHGEIECQCEECSIVNTMDMIDYFTTEALDSCSVEHLEQILHQFAEVAKIQGIKEYLFSATEINMDTMIGLDVFTNNFFNSKKQQNSKFYGNSDDYGHWKDRL